MDLHDLVMMVRWFWPGVLITLRIFFFVVVISTAGGVVLGTLRSLKIPVLDFIFSIYIGIERGIPLLVLLLVSYFVFHLGGKIQTAIIALSFYYIAYLGEIVKGGIKAVPKGQVEAANALGLDLFQRMWFIILPEVFYPILPSILNQYILMVKSTAIVSVIGAQDVLLLAGALSQITFRPLEIYFFVALIFFVICYSLQQLEKVAKGNKNILKVKKI